ncbi:hypothetical protein PoB_005834800 [Plakobranchus ocellatus]|uniref:Uncharacterized protein n=1 Tax=Plakobranchus ocellatus TaxID=259542 RepID=A0AAV4CL36_9GAST|nr:hypothetical protein PoB_005834800 [Plakobranchus ocellatus]
MEQESNPDVKPDVRFSLYEKTPDIQSLPVTVETTDLDCETNLDSLYLMPEQKPDIKLIFVQDEQSACSVASTSSPDVSISVTTCSSVSNPHCDNPEWRKQESIESVKSEPDSQACGDGTTEEKPCIAALRALVEEYSRKEEQKDGELERTSARSTEMSSLDLPKDDTCFVPSVSSQDGSGGVRSHFTSIARGHSQLALMAQVVLGHISLPIATGHSQLAQVVLGHISLPIARGHSQLAQ